jgi:hypothetical protein
VTKDYQFCPRCDVTMDLHPEADEGDEWACDIAGKKADLLEQFGGLIPHA